MAPGAEAALVMTGGEVRRFETKRVVRWFNIVAYFLLVAVALALSWYGQWVLAGICAGLLLLVVWGARHEVYQRVDVEEMGIRYRRALGREQWLYWSHVSGARLRGHWLELRGKPKGIRIWVGAGFGDKEKSELLGLLAEYLPDFVHIVSPPTVADLEPPEGLPLVTRIKVGWLLFLLAFVLPMGLVFLGLAVISGSMVFQVEKWWEGMFICLFALFLGAMGLLTLVWVVHEVAQKVRLDGEGVRLWSWWRGGYLAWSEIADVTVGNGNVRLRGKGKRLSFMAGWFPAGERELFRKALGYYVVLHEIPVKRGQWLLP
jgi:hypothetical protein